jgi:hypothetical protein
MRKKRMNGAPVVRGSTKADSLREWKEKQQQRCIAAMQNKTAAPEGAAVFAWERGLLNVEV